MIARRRLLDGRPVVQRTWDVSAPPAPARARKRYPVRWAAQTPAEVMSLSTEVLVTIRMTGATGDLASGRYRR